MPIYAVELPPDLSGLTNAELRALALEGLRQREREVQRAAGRQAALFIPVTPETLEALATLARLHECEITAYTADVVARHVFHHRLLLRASGLEVRR